MMSSFDPSKFATTQTKPLPVCLMLDVSGSMYGQKIDELNRAVKDMLATFAQEERMEREILVSIITFGGPARLHLAPTRASRVDFVELEADGHTPLAAAVKIAKDLVEDKTRIPSRAYRPTIVLVSDGQPTDEYGQRTDDWIVPLNSFVGDGRSAKCDRMAMAIGRDADEEVLNRFVHGTPHQLFYAKNASQLHEFFQRVTMSVTMRSTSATPDVIPADSEIKLDGRSLPNAAVGEPAAKNSAASQVDDDDSGYW
jgi:uncharacterized protein YegL